MREPDRSKNLSYGRSARREHGIVVDRFAIERVLPRSESRQWVFAEAQRLAVKLQVAPRWHWDLMK
jgi:hypothetical protein